MNFAFRTAVKRQLWQLGHVSEQLRDRRLPALPRAVNRREVGVQNAKRSEEYLVV